MKQFKKTTVPDKPIIFFGGRPRSFLSHGRQICECLPARAVGGITG
jgi:hypothetical protein